MGVCPSGDASEKRNASLESENERLKAELEARTNSAKELRALKDAGVITEEERRLCVDLLHFGQSHVFAKWKAADEACHEKIKNAMTQLRESNTNYGGDEKGLVDYITSAQKLLQDAKEGKNPMDGYKASIPTGETLTAGTEDYKKAVKAGLANAGKCAFAIVAGGLGERLGYGGIKLGLPAETITCKTFIQYYIETILALQAYAITNGAAAELKLPLFIMTSADTHEKTMALLEAKNYFGMDSTQVTISQQDKVPSISDNEGTFGMEKDGFEIEMKPHGHGDVHSVLWNSKTQGENPENLVKSWTANGFKYLCLFQDTNFPCLHSLIAAVGVSVEKEFAMNSVCVPRMPNEAIGAICKLTGEGKPDLTINVEYNQLDAVLKATGGDFAGGDKAWQETGKSPFPGSINELVFDLKVYEDMLTKTGGTVPEFVNPKYADETNTKFKKNTRLECMMQDYPRLLQDGQSVGFTSINRTALRQYSPVKNNQADAAAKQAAGNDPACASAGEMDVYRLNCDLLKEAGVQLPEPVAAKLSFPIWPEGTKSIEVDAPAAQVVLHPGFAIDVASHIQGTVALGKGSTLIVTDGSAILKDLTVKENSTYVAGAGEHTGEQGADATTFTALTAEESTAATEWKRIRGFKVTGVPASAVVEVV